MLICKNIIGGYPYRYKSDKSFKPVNDNQTIPFPVIPYDGKLHFVSRYHANRILRGDIVLHHTKAYYLPRAAAYWAWQLLAHSDIACRNRKTGDIYAGKFTIVGVVFVPDDAPYLVLDHPDNTIRYYRDSRFLLYKLAPL